jgi:hypothetical protein
VEVGELRPDDHKMNPSDENPLHDWVVLFKDPDAKGNGQRKTFESEQEAIGFCFSEGKRLRRHIFCVGWLNKTTNELTIKAEYQDGEDLEIERAVKRCLYISSLVKKEGTLRFQLELLPFLSHLKNEIRLARKDRDDAVDRLRVYFLSNLIKRMRRAKQDEAADQVLKFM